MQTEPNASPLAFCGTVLSAALLLVLSGCGGGSAEETAQSSGTTQCGFTKQTCSTQTAYGYNCGALGCPPYTYQVCTGGDYVCTTPKNKAELIDFTFRTKIEPYDFEAGMKSEQLIRVDFTNRVVSDSGFITGPTTLWFVELQAASARTKFTLKSSEWLSDEKVRFTVAGQTASGVQFMPNINYDFTIVVQKDGHGNIVGCHNQYPSYQVVIDGRIDPVYYFPHEKSNIFQAFGRLWGPCDTLVKPVPRAF